MAFGMRLSNVDAFYWRQGSMKMRPKTIACKTVLLTAAILMLLPVAVHTQTVEECYAERDKLQEWIGNQESQDEYQHAQALIEQADLHASQGDGKKCMDLIKEADGSAHALGGN